MSGKIFIRACLVHANIWLSTCAPGWGAGFMMKLNTEGLCASTKEIK